MNALPIVFKPALVALALATATAFAQQPAPAAPAPALSFMTVRVSDGPRSVALDAVVEAVRQTTLSAQVSGAIVALSVKAGDTVRAGQPLLRIDAQSAQQGVAASVAQVEAAQAQLNIAVRELDRQKQLFAQQYISQAALDRTAAQVDAAQAQVRALQAQTRASQAQTGFFTVSAPYAGVVSEVPVTQGDMVMPGRPLVVLHDPAALRLSAAVPQALMGAAANPAAVQYEVPGVADGARKRPTAVQVLPAVDAATHTAQLRVPLPLGTQGAVPGMFARIWLDAPASAGAPGRVFVPRTAVVRRSELVAVYVLDAAGLARLRQVRLGPVAGDQVEVLAGLMDGDRVALDPQQAARTR